MFSVSPLRTTLSIPMHTPREAPGIRSWPTLRHVGTPAWPFHSETTEPSATLQALTARSAHPDRTYLPSAVRQASRAVPPSGILLWTCVDARGDARSARLKGQARPPSAGVRSVVERDQGPRLLTLALSGTAMACICTAVPSAHAAPFRMASLEEPTTPHTLRSTVPSNASMT